MFDFFVLLWKYFSKFSRHEKRVFCYTKVVVGFSFFRLAIHFLFSPIFSSNVDILDENLWVLYEICFVYRWIEFGIYNCGCLEIDQKSSFWVRNWRILHQSGEPLSTKKKVPNLLYKLGQVNSFGEIFENIIIVING